VAAARSRSSPLHKTLEWDDARAGHQFRLIQARTVIRAVVIVPERKDSPPVRAFVNLHVDRQDQYVPAVIARENPFLRKQVVDKAKRELASWLRRYGTLDEFESVVKAAEVLLASGNGEERRREAQK